MKSHSDLNRHHSTSLSAAQLDTETQFVVLYRRFFDVLCQYASKITKDEFAAKDIVQKIFVRLYTNGRLPFVQKPEQYLYHSIYTGCIDYFRKQGRLKEYYPGDLPESFYWKEASDEQVRMADVINRGIALLPSRQREVFIRCRLKGYSYKEIAAELGISEKTVGNQMGSALKKIHLYLLKNNVKL